jgi:hypothetical protein
VCCIILIFFFLAELQRVDLNLKKFVLSVWIILNCIMVRVIYSIVLWSMWMVSFVYNNIIHLLLRMDILLCISLLKKVIPRSQNCCCLEVQLSTASQRMTWHQCILQLKKTKCPSLRFLSGTSLRLIRRQRCSLFKLYLETSCIFLQFDCFGYYLTELSWSCIYVSNGSDGSSALSREAVHISA